MTKEKIHNDDTLICKCGQRKEMHEKGHRPKYFLACSKFEPKEELKKND